MALLSLKHYLHAGEAELAMGKVVSLLMESMGTTAVESNHAECEAFREEMRQIRERGSGDASPEALFLTAGLAVQATTDYNRRITAFLRRQGGELHSIVGMIAETALRIGGESTASAQRLQEIGNRFEKARELEDLHSLKTHLKDCLQSFREETERQKAESEAAMRALHRELERRSAHAAAVMPEDADPVTGLAREKAGIRAMQEAVMSGKRLHVVCMAVKGVQQVNTRFGFEIGDRMLRLFTENVERHLMRADKLYRWNGPAMVALLDRTESVEQLRVQLRRRLDTPIEGSFDGGGRAVMIPIASAWTLFAVTPPVSLTVNQIQAFIASQGYPVISC